MFTSLYIHVPFCHGKCAYCAFYSLPSSTPDLRQRYLAHLREEFARYAPQCVPLRSIFIGGGTPSLLSRTEWEELVRAIRDHFTLAPDCEWSCEANPDSLSPELLQAWLACGVNRISIGIQSFHSDLRRRIGRCGSLPKQFPNIPPNCSLNLDLIFNIPGQTLAQWEEDLHRALELSPSHISCYALTLEEGTRLAKNTPPLSDEQFLQFWEATDRILAEADIRRYEISNFARHGKECRHNLEIWKGGTYLGCGPAAASFDGTERHANPSSLVEWLNNTPPERDPLPPEERATEILATGLRLLSGWDRQEFQHRTGFDAWDLRGKQMRKLQQQGLLHLTENHVSPTQQGLLFNDNIALELL